MNHGFFSLHFHANGRKNSDELFFRDELKFAPFESKSWPHLVGKPIDEAIEEIKRENPGKLIDLSLDKIFIFIDFR